jgi:hypothetical protein
VAVGPAMWRDVALLRGFFWRRVDYSAVVHDRFPGVWAWIAECLATSNGFSDAGLTCLGHNLYCIREDYNGVSGIWIDILLQEPAPADAVYVLTAGRRVQRSIRRPCITARVARRSGCRKNKGLRTKVERAAA